MVIPIIFYNFYDSERIVLVICNPPLFPEQYHIGVGVEKNHRNTVPIISPFREKEMFRVV